MRHSKLNSQDAAVKSSHLRFEILHPYCQPPTISISCSCFHFKAEAAELTAATECLRNVQTLVFVMQLKPLCKSLVKLASFFATRQSGAAVTTQRPLAPQTVRRIDSFYWMWQSVGWPRLPQQRTARVTILIVGHRTAAFPPCFQGCQSLSIKSYGL